MIDAVWDFVSGFPSAEIPEPAKHVMRRASVDYLGLTIAGSRTTDAVSVRRSVAIEGAGPCLVIGTDQRASAQGAALSNASAAHSLALDDFSAAARGHVTTVVLSAAIAAAQLLGRSDSDLVDAYVVGYEVECAIGALVSAEQYARGWHPTATIGVFGAAAAAARLWNLSPGQVESAFGVAAALSSGIRGSIGSALKSVQVAHAAAKGLLAVELAACGLPVGERALGSEHSFFALFNGRADLDWRPLRALGSRWDLVEDGPRFVLVKGGDRLALGDDEVAARFEAVAAESAGPDELRAVRDWLAGSGRYLETVAAFSR